MHKWDYRVIGAGESDDDIHSSVTWTDYIILWEKNGAYGIEVIILPTQHPVTMALLISFFFKFLTHLHFPLFLSVCFFSNGDTLDGEHLLDSTNLAILAEVSHNDERTAPSSIFSDEIDCN